MLPLFTTEENNLTDFFAALSSDDIQECCESKIYHRGVEYYNSGIVNDASYHSSKKGIETVVEGNSNYDVKITLDNGEVSGSCSCPYDDVCKHIIATLLYATNSFSEFKIIPESKNMDDQTKQYLKSLPKDALIRLVMKYAPEQFYVEVKNKFSDSSMALTVFKKVDQEIQKLFEDEDLIYSPIDFDHALTKSITKLAKLEKHLKTELESLIFGIMSKVDKAIDDGYLDDYYHDESYNPSVEFIEFITNYAKCLDYDGKIAFIYKLQTILDEQSYTTFQQLYELPKEIFSEDDLPSLKNMLMRDYQNFSDHLKEKYYDQVRELLTGKEKEEILAIIQFNGSHKLMELVHLYESQNEKLKAIDVIKSWLEKNNKSYREESVYFVYFDLLNETQQSISEVAKEALLHCAKSSMLQKIVSLDNSAISEYELILEKKNPGQLLEYFEKHSRLPEALALIKRSKSIWEKSVYDFFKRHKKDFPKEAEKQFCDVIDKNLENAGDVYYQAVSDAIDQLIKINMPLALEYLQSIRLNYKRRRNLISILSRF